MSTLLLMWLIRVCISSLFSVAVGCFSGGCGVSGLFVAYLDVKKISTIKKVKKNVPGSRRVCISSLFSVVVGCFSDGCGVSGRFVAYLDVKNTLVQLKEGEKKCTWLASASRAFLLSS